MNDHKAVISSYQSTCKGYDVFSKKIKAYCFSRTLLRKQKIIIKRATDLVIDFIALGVQ